MSTMFALGPGHSPSTPPEVASSHDSSHGAESSTTSTPVIEVQELPSPNEQSIEPSGSVISGATLLDQPGSRSSQSTPLGCIYETDLQPIPRPSSAPGLMPSRFSTSIPGRALSSRVDSIEGTDNLLAVPWTGQIPPFEPTRADDSRTLPTDNGPSSVESVESSPGGEQAFVTPLPAATPVSISASMAETASNNAAICDGCAAAAVQDSDPPFMTDGRGRVVWSSSTAGARSRRGRTTAPLSAVMTSRDKPRGDAQTRDHSQTNSPVVRPASLARGGSGRHDRQSVPDRGE
ncbi:hypothetical protein BDW22DRAFT_1356858 [Trametopsis cervina]|nr:hypothetical protein BDW22DRAFT_1356858 [Trametopsis cervina]